MFSVDIKYITNDGKEWICKTCDRALMRGSMPQQASLWSLELADLNALEISLCVPFMKIVALPSGKQQSIMD